MENKSVTTNNGVGFGGMLTIVFIVLKLTGIIQWSWVWVLSPIWVSLLVVILLLLITAISVAKN